MIRLDGAVETSVQLGVADVIADVVETGSTLRQAGLEIVGDVILESEAVLVSRADAAEPPGARGVPAPAAGRPGGPLLRDDGLRHPRRARVEEAVALTPGIESPTVSPLHREGWVAVRSMVPRADAQRIMDELYEIGARGILTTDIHACRL